MADLRDKGSTEIKQEMSSSSCSGSVSSLSSDTRVKTCADCGTAKTPLWRGGPAGPKSLCNACGIRNRKKRWALLGLNKASTEHKKAKKIDSNRTISSNTSSSSNNSSLQDSIESKLLAFRVPMTWQKTKVRRKLGEEERAAMLLLALSYGSVYA